MSARTGRDRAAAVARSCECPACVDIPQNRSRLQSWHAHGSDHHAAGTALPLHGVGRVGGVPRRHAARRSRGTPAPGTTKRRLLAARYRVLALDQRGHGDSDPAPDDRLLRRRPARRPRGLRGGARPGPDLAGRPVARRAGWPSTSPAITPRGSSAWSSSTSARRSSRAGGPASASSWPPPPSASRRSTRSSPTSAPTLRSTARPCCASAPSTRCGRCPAAAWDGSTTGRCATRSARVACGCRPIFGRSGARSPARPCWCAAPCPTCCRRKPPSDG